MQTDANTEGSVAPPTFADAVTEAYKLRDQIDEIETDQAEELKPYKEALAAWETHILKFLIDSGQQKSAVKDVGTVYIRLVESFTVQDWGATWQYMQVSENFDLLEHKVNKTAAKAYIEKTGSPVPGTSYSAINKVGYNRAR